MSHRLSLILGSTVLAVALGGCRDPGLKVVAGDVTVEPARLEFPDAFVGYPVDRTLTLFNTSRGPARVELSAPLPFRVEGDLTRELQGGESAAVRVFFEPDQAGTSKATLELRVDSERAELPLLGNAIAPPQCQPTTTCRTSTFDPAAGACAETSLPNGEVCASGSACLQNTRCVDGECLGEAVSCDDGNPCTKDACEAAAGCVHHDAANACPGPDEPCKVAFCDPQTGCGITDVADGTSCGEADCVTAQVCVAGACKTLSVPNGASCGVATPCRERGVCQDQLCVQPPATDLAPTWTYPPVGQTGVPYVHFFGAADEQDNLYWAECGTSCSVVSATRNGAIRWRVPAVGTNDPVLQNPTGQLVSGTVLITLVSRSVVEARRLNDGALLWSHDVASEYWHATGETVNGAPVVSTRLGMAGADLFQLVVPFEGWVEQSGAPVLAARFAIAFDLLTGTKRWQAPLYGHSGSVAIDETGGVFISSATYAGNGTPSYKLEAFGPLGAPLWSAFSQHGAWPSVAEGTVFVDGLAAFDGASGAAKWSASGLSTPALIHEGSYWVLTQGTSPATLYRANLSTNANLWSHPFPSGTAGSNELTLTDSSSVLYPMRKFDTSPSQLHLVAVTAEGETGFSCRFPKAAFDIDDATVLIDGRWVAELHFEGLQRVMAFDVPGYRPARSGWTAPRGANGRAGAALAK